MDAEALAITDDDRAQALHILAEMSHGAGAAVVAPMRPDADEGFGMLASYALAAQLGATAARGAGDAGIEPRRSTVPMAGQGLFATRRWVRGACICCYRGSVLRTPSPAGE